LTIPTRKFGRNGPDLTILGFGAMRLPGFRYARQYEASMEGAVHLIRRAIEGGVNYIDTAQLYDEGNSEIAVGKAIQGCREQVYISTKVLPNMISLPGDLAGLLETSCERLQTGRVDILYFHGLAWKQFETQFTEINLLKEIERLQTAGRIGLCGFSSHDTPENIGRLIDSGVFEGMLVQYNLIDERNAAVIDRAHEKGMGVALMGPMGGGRLAGAGPDFTRLVPEQFGNAPAMALKFVWSNPAVVTALSGMESETVLEKNVKLAETFSPLTAAENERTEVFRKKLEGLNEMYCSGCGYCLPCEQRVNIPGIFHLLICREIFGAEQYAKDMYKLIGIVPVIPGRNGSQCIACGECEDKCPQHISIIEQLKRTHELLSE